MDKLAYLSVRLGIASSMLGHGIVRMPKLQAFSDWMVGKFSNSMIPEIMVLPFSFLVPFVELGLGVTLLLGIKTRVSVFVGAMLMCCLLFGSSMIEQWGILPSQFIHLAFFVVLIQYSKSDSFNIIE